MTFPINKKLWSSSFVLLTTGIDLVVISALVYILEIRNHNEFKWTNFFLVFGKNPLFIYLLSEVLVIIFYMIPVGREKPCLLQSIQPFSRLSLLVQLARFVCYMLYVIVLVGGLLVK
jgi:predicted acyltransferase